MLYLRKPAPIFDSWRTKKTVTNPINMGIVAVFAFAAICAIFCHCAMISVLSVL